MFLNSSANDMSGRPWTKREIAYLKRWHLRRPMRTIAAHLGRSEKSVQQGAVTQGITQHFPRQQPAEVRTLRRLNKEGYTDTEAAGVLGRSRKTIHRWHRRMKLKSNAYGKRVRAAVASKTAEQCRAAGVSSLGALRGLVLSQRAEAMGWPKGVRWRAAQILDMLYQVWPRGMTRRSIVANLGMTWRGKRSLKSNDPHGTYLAELEAKGLLVALGRGVRTGPGKGNAVWAYTLPVAVMLKHADWLLNEALRQKRKKR